LLVPLSLIKKMILKTIKLIRQNIGKQLVLVVKNLLPINGNTEIIVQRKIALNLSSKPFAIYEYLGAYVVNNLFLLLYALLVNAFLSLTYRR
jgi:hypothetical protein